MAIAELQDRRKFNEIHYSHYKESSGQDGGSRGKYEDVLKPAVFPEAIELIPACKLASGSGHRFPGCHD